MLTIVNLSWHAMEVSIQETTVAVRQGITAAALSASASGIDDAKPSSLAACGSRSSHYNERQMLAGSSSKDTEA